MSATEKQMTPEEKLLALIQQDKRHVENVAQPPAGSVPQAAREPVAEMIKAEPKTLRKETVAERPEPEAPVMPAVSKPIPAPAPSVVPPASQPLSPAPESPSKTPPAVVKLKLVATPEVKTPKPEARPAQSDAGKGVATLPSPSPVPSSGMAGSFVFSGPSSFGGLSMIHLNRVLGVVVIVLIAIVFYSVGGIQMAIDDSLERQVSGAGRVPMSALAVPEGDVQSLDAYLDKVGARNIFMLKTAASKDAGGGKSEPVSGIKELKLTAVSIDSSSPGESTAIIRNKTDSKTYFVKPGQSVGSTEYVLEQVFGDHVVLKSRKQEIELR